MAKFLSCEMYSIVIRSKLVGQIVTFLGIKKIFQCQGNAKTTQKLSIFLLIDCIRYNTDVIFYLII